MSAPARSPLLLLLLPLAATAADGDRVSVCHLDEVTGVEDLLLLPPGAAARHLDRHGDRLATEETCGDGVDDDCDGLVDEGCCPLYEAFGGLPVVADYARAAAGEVRLADFAPATDETWTSLRFDGATLAGDSLFLDYWLRDFGTDLEAAYGREGLVEYEWYAYEAATDTWEASPSNTATLADADFAVCTDVAVAWALASGLPLVDERDGL